MAQSAGPHCRGDIDVVGGGIYELTFPEAGATESGIRDVFNQFGDENVVVQQLGDPSQYRWSVRSSIQDSATGDQIIQALGNLAPINRELLRTESVSATVGQEVTRASIVAVLVGAGVIIRSEEHTSG